MRPIPKVPKQSELMIGTLGCQTARTLLKDTWTGFSSAAVQNPAVSQRSGFGPAHPTPWRCRAMTTRLLRSLVLTTVLALVFQVSGAAPPPISPHGQPDRHPRRRHRRRRNHDPQAAALDGHAPADIRATDPVLPAAHPTTQPDPPRRYHREPDGARRRTRGRCGARPRRSTTAARHSHHRQGQHQHDWHADDRGSWALAGSTPHDAFIVRSSRPPVR